MTFPCFFEIKEYEVLSNMKSIKFQNIPFTTQSNAAKPARFEFIASMKSQEATNLHISTYSAYSSLAPPIHAEVIKRIIYVYQY